LFRTRTENSKANLQNIRIKDENMFQMF
jgi:hypothetical protein